MKYCTYCGAELQDDVKFCPNCGKSLTEEYCEPAQPASQPESPIYASQPNSVCPPTYLLFSILTTLFCCLPFGIVGIVNSASVNGKFVSGDFAGAEKASRNAKTWSIVALCCGILWIVIYIIAIIVALITDRTNYLFT